MELERLRNEDIEEWKRGILELPDELFFSIMRTYLGEIRTPFHKPALVDRLAHFLTHEETVRRILGLIDERDAVFLSAIDLLGKPQLGTLYSLFEEEMDYFTFHGRLRNLQERLLVYHRAGDDSISLNPILHPSMKHGIIRPSLLYQYRLLEDGAAATEEEEEDGSESRERKLLGEIHLLTLLSFIFSDGKLLKSDGSLKKKSHEQLRKIFAAGGLEDTQIFRLLHAALELELVERVENSLIPKRRVIEAFGTLPRSVRVSALWSAALLGDGGNEVIEKRSGSTALVYRRAELLRKVLDSMPENVVFTFVGLRRLIRISSLLLGGTERYLPFRPEELLDMGLIEERDEGIALCPECIRETKLQPEEKPIIIQPDFSVTIKPPLEFSVGRRIGELFDLQSFDLYPRYELTKYSYTRARSHSFDYESLLEFIEKESETEIPHNITMTIKAWERAFSGIRLYEGVVLQVDEERSHLVDHTPGLQEHILHSFGNGIYLLDPSSIEEWRRALEKSGIEPVPPIRRPAAERSESGTERMEPGLSAVKQAGERRTESPAETPDPQSITGAKAGGPTGYLDPEALKKELYSAAEPLQLSENQRRELQRCIDHKLVLFPEQVGPHLLSGETTEARGIDYSGKVRIVEQSVAKRFDLLEIVLRMPTGKPKRMLLQPERLERGDKELYLGGRELPHGEIQRIPVGKISYVKRWKSSLFSGFENPS